MFLKQYLKIKFISVSKYVRADNSNVINWIVDGVFSLTWSTITSTPEETKIHKESLLFITELTYQQLI